MKPEQNNYHDPASSVGGAAFVPTEPGAVVGMASAEPSHVGDSAPFGANDTNVFAAPPRPSRNWREIISTIALLALAPIIALLIILFAIQSYQVDGQSMEQTLQDHDRLIVDKLPRTLSRITGHPYVPHRGDIIIFNQGNLPDTVPGETKQLIKRVIGLPGDRVVVRNGKITIYDQQNPGGFDPDKVAGYKIANTITTGDKTWDIQAHQIFVCGDNRPNSEDSRYFGPVNASQIVGKLVLRLLPLSKAQSF